VLKLLNSLKPKVSWDLPLLGQLFCFWRVPVPETVRQVRHGWEPTETHDHGYPGTRMGIWVRSIPWVWFPPMKVPTQGHKHASVPSRSVPFFKAKRPKLFQPWHPNQDLHDFSVIQMWGVLTIHLKPKVSWDLPLLGQLFCFWRLPVPETVRQVRHGSEPTETHDHGYPGTRMGIWVRSIPWIPFPPMKVPTRGHKHASVPSRSVPFFNAKRPKLFQPWHPNQDLHDFSVIQMCGVLTIHLKPKLSWDLPLLGQLFCFWRLPVPETVRQVRHGWEPTETHDHGYPGTRMGIASTLVIQYRPFKVLRCLKLLSYTMT
jgi:hypothetical protein